jgi:hypothetical protein
MLTSFSAGLVGSLTVGKNVDLQKGRCEIAVLLPETLAFIG